MQKLKLFLIFFIFTSQSAFAEILKFEKSHPLVQKELSKLEYALRSDDKARLPQQLIVKVGLKQSLPDRAGCEETVESRYINKNLEMNESLLLLMGTSEYSKQYKGCSHKIALFLALEKVLHQYKTSSKTDIEKRKLTQSQHRLVKNIIESIIQRTHNLLLREKVKIDIFDIDSDEFFMISNFKLERILGKDHYRIGINPKIFALDIPKEALVAVLAHELQHTMDYAKKSFIAGIIPIGIKVLIKKYRYRYERQTDLKTVLNGYGDGLISYKRWQYRLLSKEDLKVKRENYLTPGEIELIQRNLKNKKARIKRALSGRMPKNLEEWKKYLN